MPAPNLRRFLSRDQGEVGVGTLIIFIAMVLVAAVAAAVIIGTSGSLQERAQSTGREATADVSSNLKVMSVHGVRATIADDIRELRIGVTLAAGSPHLDLSETIIRYSDGTNVDIYRLGDPTLPFTLSWIRPAANPDSVMESGDFVEVVIALGTDLPVRSDFRLQLIHIVGAPQELELKTPPTYSDNIYVFIR